jgi:hypothetical protein
LPPKKKSITEILVQETSIIDENDTLLDANGYFNIDAELA